jgi:hypothetical protein
MKTRRSMMRKTFNASKRSPADHDAAVVLAKLERALTDSELDQVAAAGGKTGASSNPVED